MEKATSHRQALPYRMRAFFAVVFATAFLTISPCSAEAASPTVTRKSHWISSEKGSLRCVGNDGKTLLKFKKSTPTYESNLPEIPPDYRSINFIVLEKGASAAVFDYNNGGTTVTFYLRGCSPSRTYIYPAVELDGYTHNLKSGLGLVVALASVDATFSEDSDRRVYFVHWDSSGTERINAGPYRFASGNAQLAMFQEERFGEYIFEDRGFTHIYFDFLKGAYYKYVQPGDMRGGKQEITPDGQLRFYQLTGYKTLGGKILTPEEYTGLPLPEFQRIANSVVPQYRLIHEHQF